MLEIDAHSSAWRDTFIFCLIYVFLRLFFKLFGLRMLLTSQLAASIYRLPISKRDTNQLGGGAQKNLLSATPPLGIVCGEYSENYP